MLANDFQARTHSANTGHGLKVYYYVREGPTEVDGDVLKFTPIPPRAKFPVRGTVVAWQHGLPGKLKPPNRCPRHFTLLGSHAAHH